MKDELSVWLGASQIGTLSEKKGRLEFIYLPQWLKSDQAQPLSLSLPLSSTPYNDDQCRAYFAGLLPEGDQRKGITKILHASKQDDFFLLSTLAGECVGSVSIHPQSKTALKFIIGKSKLSWLDSPALLNILKSLPIPPRRTCLPGDERQLPIIYQNNRFALPEEDILSTHIIKIASSNLPGQLENEYFCLSLASKCGINTVNVQLMDLEGQRVLLRNRFDRLVKKNSATQPLMCEDFCQALGIGPEKKYQKDGGPSLSDCFSLLRNHTRPFAANVSQLFDRTLFNLLIGNHMAHGKQFYLVFKDNRWQLAPLTSVMSTVVYQEMPNKAAMKLGGKYRFSSLMSEHLEKFVTSAQLSHAMCRKRANLFVQQMTEHAQKIYLSHQQLYGKSSTVDAIIQVINQRCQTMQEILSKPTNSKLASE